MCGIAGFQGVPLAASARELLVWGLGEGIDTRGGHAAGFIATGGASGLQSHRKDGCWSEVKSLRFIKRAAEGQSVLMHARYATHGSRIASNAHPFAIKREGRTVLWGMHNGILYNAQQSAEAHGRDFTVDSRELFELLADGETAKIENLQGYGVISWIDADDPHCPRLCKISEDGDLVVARIRGGGCAWASTKKILLDGIKWADLHVEAYYDVKPHKVHIVKNGELYVREDSLKVSSGYGIARSSLTSGIVGGFSRYRISDRWIDDDEWLRSYTAHEMRKGRAREERKEQQIELEIYTTSNDLADEFADEFADEEDDYHKQEICSLYGIDPDTVKDMDSGEVSEMVRRWCR